MLKIETKKITETVIVEKEILVINGIEINDTFFNKYKIDKISKYHSFNDSFPIGWSIELMEDFDIEPFQDIKYGEITYEGRDYPYYDYGFGTIKLSNELFEEFFNKLISLY